MKSSAKVVVVIFAGFGVLVIIVLALDKFNRAKPQPHPKLAVAGDVAILQLEEGPSIPLTFTEVDYKEAVQYIETDNFAAQRKMITEGLLSNTPAGTKCLVLQLHVVHTNVYFLTGPHNGREGYVPTRAVKRNHF